MSSEVNKTKFLTEEYSVRTDDRSWRDRREAPNAFDKPSDWSYAKSAFRFSVDVDLRSRYDEVLKPENLEGGLVPKGLKVTELPEGYSIVLDLYKDVEFMINIRFQAKAIIDEYLVKKHPMVVDYLKAHNLRVVSQVVGLNEYDNRRILLAENVAVCSTSTAMTMGGITVAAAASAATAAVTAAAVVSTATACAVATSNSSGSAA